MHHMQMVRICVCHTYADARHMDMLYIYLLLSFLAEIRKKAEAEIADAICSGSKSSNKAL